MSLGSALFGVTAKGSDFWTALPPAIEGVVRLQVTLAGSNPHFQPEDVLGRLERVCRNAVERWTCKRGRYSVSYLERVHTARECVHDVVHAVVASIIGAGAEDLDLGSALERLERDCLPVGTTTIRLRDWRAEQLVALLAIRHVDLFLRSTFGVHQVTEDGQRSWRRSVPVTAEPEDVMGMPDTPTVQRLVEEAVTFLRLNSPTPITAEAAAAFVGLRQNGASLHEARKALGVGLRKVTTWSQTLEAWRPGTVHAVQAEPDRSRRGSFWTGLHERQGLRAVDKTWTEPEECVERIGGVDAKGGLRGALLRMDGGKVVHTYLRQGVAA